MKSDITKLLSQIYRERGFRKLGGEWLRESDGVVHITRTIKSRYSGERLVDLGVRDLAFVPDDARLKDRWHFEARLDSLFSNRLDILKVFDSDVDMADAIREREIRLLWDKVEEIFFNRFNSADKAREYVKQHGLTRHPILVFYYYGQFVEQL